MVPTLSTMMPGQISLVNEVARSVPVLTNRSTGVAVDAGTMSALFDITHSPSLITAALSARVAAAGLADFAAGRVGEADADGGVTDDGLVVERQHTGVADRLQPTRRG